MFAEGEQRGSLTERFTFCQFSHSPFAYDHCTLWLMQKYFLLKILAVGHI